MRLQRILAAVIVTALLLSGFTDNLPALLVGVNKPVGMSSHDVVNRCRKVASSFPKAFSTAFQSTKWGMMMPDSVISQFPGTRILVFRIRRNSRTVKVEALRLVI